MGPEYLDDGGTFAENDAEARPCGVRPRPSYWPVVVHKASELDTAGV